MITRRLVGLIGLVATIVLVHLLILSGLDWATEGV